ncbi:MAG: hypothetical protein QM725_09555 [Lacibacter sp.]
MFYIKLFFVLVIFSGFQTTKITVIGKAGNSKAGAVIVTKTNKVYYIDKLDFWGKKYLGHTVKVSGVLKTFVNKRDITVQQVEGKIHLIVNAKWSLCNP